jgi:hypothetical protein
MRVQRVLMPGSEAESWTLLGDDQVQIEPMERFPGLPGLGREGRELRPLAATAARRLTAVASYGPRVQPEREPPKDACRMLAGKRWKRVESRLIGAEG